MRTEAKSWPGAFGDWTGFIDNIRALPFRFARAALVCFTFVGLTLIMTWPQAAHLREVRDHFDPIFSIWRLEWVAHQLPRQPMHLFDTNILHPAPLTLAYSDAMLLPAVLTAPALWMGASGPVVYNLLLLLAFALSGVTMFLLVRELTHHDGAALLAGIIFEFSPIRFEHFHHLELQFVFWIPLSLYFLVRAARSGRLRDGLFVGACFAAQTLSCIYYGVFLVTFYAIGGVVWFAASRFQRYWRSVSAISQPSLARPAAIGLTIGVVCSLLTIGLYARPYVNASTVLGTMRLVQDVQQYSAQPVNFLASPPHNRLYGWTADRFGGNERNLFPGGIAIILAVIGLCRPSRAKLLMVLGALAAFDLSLGFNGVVYPWLYAHATPFRGLRAPARAGIFVSFFVALLAGSGAAWLLGSLRSSIWRIALLTGLVGAIGVEYQMRPLERVELPARPPDVYRYLARIPPSVILELPVAEPDRIGVSIDVFYMYYSTFHWQRLLNGYSGFMPRSYSRLLEILRTFPDERSIRELHYRKVDYVVVHSGMDHWSFMSDATLQERTSVSPALAIAGCYGGPGGKSCVYRVLPESAERRDESGAHRGRAE